jgi:hypothetical protein
MQVNAETGTASADHSNQSSLATILNRRKLLSEFFTHFALYFVIFVVLGLVRSHWHFNSEFFIMDTFGAIVGASGIAGTRELRRGGHKKVLRNFANGIGLPFAILLIVIGVIGILAIFKVYFSHYVFEIVIYTLLGVSCAMSVAALPVALYLNFKQKKSTQPTIANAS